METILLVWASGNSGEMQIVDVVNRETVCDYSTVDGIVAAATHLLALYAWHKIIIYEQGEATVITGALAAEFGADKVVAI